MYSWRIPVFGLCLFLCVLLATIATSAEPPVDLDEPPADSIIAVLPFESGPRWANRIMVDLAPEGRRSMVWMLDTGATSNILTPLAARAMGVSVRRNKSSRYRRATRLGRDVQFWVDTRTSDQRSKTGFEYGLLGGDFLERYVVELDFVNRRVRFMNPKKYRLPKSVEATDQVVLPIRITSGRPFVDIERGEQAVSVILDTGAPGTLLLSGKAARKLEIDVDELPEAGVIGSTQGPVQVRGYEARDFSLAGFRLDPMPVIVAPRGIYNQGGSSDSILGYEVLRHFTVRIDYPRKRLWLRREAESRDEVSLR